ncbi:MAG: NERD domain-containing protein [Proteobacteria bacterium]|nr:NERD domain-containing protein [Pseudomonadota bacterium]
MAQMYPNSERIRVVFASQAEEQFYQLCRKLPADWSVYYSCTLSEIEADQGMTDNEIDFVLYHPKLGVIVVEIKGGRIIYQPEIQQFFSENRFGERFAIKNPFAQALNWKSRFLRYLKKKDIRVPISHLACLPSLNEKDFPERSDAPSALLLGRQKLENLETALIEAVQHQHESKVKDVEHIHESLVSPMTGNRRLAVEGEAGTGKTMLAVALAKHFRDLGSHVLLLSSNPVLNQFLKTQVGSRIEVQTYAEFAAKFGVDILKRPPDFQGTREDWIQYVGPEKLKAAILQSTVRFDTLLCDEAQDVQPFWWEAIEASLRDEMSHFYIFFDRSQGVFGSGSAEGTFVPEDMLPISTPYFPLVNNYRTTKEISSFSRSFRTGRQIMNSYSARLGYLPEIITYKDAQEARDKLQSLVSRLTENEGLQSNELTILSARRPFQDASIFTGAKQLGAYTLIDTGNEKQGKIPQKTLAVSTIQAFKGLETSVGIIVNLSEYHMPLTNPILASLFYVACTRAKHMLYIFLQESDPKREAVQKALDAISRKGSLVIGEPAHDHAYSGTVSYFNPDRLGWLTVDDSSLQRNTLMFFPVDIKASNGAQIAVGSRLSFRVKLEGYAPIATDIKILEPAK